LPSKDPGRTRPHQTLHEQRDVVDDVLAVVEHQQDASGAEVLGEQGQKITSTRRHPEQNRDLRRDGVS
jgi:hypothetical protein